MWRVIPLAPRHPYFIAASEEALLHFSENGKTPPTIVLNIWEKPAISISANQDIDDINRLAAVSKGYDIVRTRVGGRAVIHHPGWGISYTIADKLDNYETRDPRKLYDIHCGKIHQALRRIGVDSELRNFNDIYVSGKKLSGNAQKIGKNAMVQSGIILYEKPDAGEMIELMNGYDRNGDLRSLESTLTGITEHRDVSREYLAFSLVDAFTEGRESRNGDWTPEEKACIENLVKDRYSTPHWHHGTSRRGLCWLPKFEALGTFKGENPG